MVNLPSRNLPREAEPWGRAHDQAVRSLESRTDRALERLESADRRIRRISDVQTQAPVFTPFRFVSDSQSEEPLPGLSSLYKAVLEADLPIPSRPGTVNLQFSMLNQYTSSSPGSDAWVATYVQVGSERSPSVGGDWYSWGSSYGRYLSVISDSVTFRSESESVPVKVFAAGSPSSYFSSPDSGDFITVSGHYWFVPDPISFEA